MATLTKQQIGKCGELLVQYELLRRGVESAPMTTDTGIDLVAYSSRKQMALTIQVKANLKPKPGGGTGKAALDWWISDDCPAELVAFVDLSEPKVWLMTFAELEQHAQQHSNGRLHIYMYTDPSAKPNKAGRLAHSYEFDRFLLENRSDELFE